MNSVLELFLKSVTERTTGAEIKDNEQNSRTEQTSRKARQRTSDKNDNYFRAAVKPKTTQLLPFIYGNERAGGGIYQERKKSDIRRKRNEQTRSLI